MPQFERDGARIHYEIAGEGPPLLLVPGIASDGASWAPLLPLLERTFTLIRIDNRGAGRTVAEGEPTIDDMVRDCAALIDHLGYEKVAVAGHSMGGLIGQRLAAACPGKVEKLVTIASSDCHGAKERTLFKDLASLYFELEPRTWFRLLFQWLFSAPFFADERVLAAAAQASADYPLRQSPEDFARQVSALAAVPPVDLLRIECPTLALAASLDLLAPPADVYAGHAGIPHLTTVVIEDAAHSVHWEQPAKVAEAMAEFLLRAGG